MSDGISIKEVLKDIEVEWKSLNDIVEFRRGSFPQPYGNSEWYGGEGSMPFVQVVDVANEGFCLNKETKKRISKLAQPKSIFVENGTVIVSLQGTIGRVAITQYDSYVDRTLAIFTNYKIDINKKYFAYQLKNKFDIEKKNARGSTLKTITKEEFSKFEIPIPPLHIQSEIVKIMDGFSELTAELTAELTTELMGRKKQYSYYRDKLFTFEDGKVEFKLLGEAGKFIRGKRFVKTDMISNGIPCIHYGEMYTHYNIWAKESKSFVSSELVKTKKLRTAEHGDVVFVAAGETIEDIGRGTAWFGDEGVVVHDACFFFKSEINPKYVAYFTRTNFFQSQVRKSISSGKISAINEKGLSKVKIPIPTREEQERIVSILDKFDTLVNSISEVLPTEIELRAKQHEYYKDLLLTFTKRDVEV